MAVKRKREAPKPQAPAEKELDPSLGGSEDEEVPSLDPSSAYRTLLTSLKSSGGSFAKAYARRQREERGESSDDEAQTSENADKLLNNGMGGDKPVDEEDLNNLEEENGMEDDERVNEEDLNKLEEENDAPGMELSDEEELERTTNESLAGVVDEFKVHLEHNLLEEEIGNLDAGKPKLKVETAALGIHKAKWITNSKSIPKSESRLSEYNVKLRLRKQWENVVKKKFGDFRSEQQCQFFALCNSYRDIFHTRKASLPGKKGATEIMDAYLLHVINHLLKTRDLIAKNNEKLHHQEANRSAAGVDTPRDQGFTRPKVLILLPFRSIVLHLVKRLIHLSPPLQKATVDHKQRFFDDFGAEEEDPENKKTSKPVDHQCLFSGNNDDHFRIGLKFTRKSIKLYSEFYSSDIVIASPLGLMTSIGEAEADKEKNVDFLSSIEILIVDFANVILMQNWSHVLSVFEHLNKIPSQQHDVDIMRVREWYLNGHARYFRQTIFLSSFADPSINALFLRSCVNHSGKLKLHCHYDGVLSRVLLQVRQVYERLECTSITDVDNARFDFFVKQVFPRIKESLQTGILLFVRSYFDFVRLRNFLKSESASFCLLGEYTKQSDISRSRAWFYHGKRRILLYTERAHFYHRFQIRGIHELIFYSLPDHPNFYAEITNMLEGVENPSCTVIFSKFDNLQLERIVGTSRAQKMLSSKTKTLMFC